MRFRAQTARQGVGSVLVLLGVAVLLASQTASWASLAFGGLIGSTTLPVDLGLRWLLVLRPGRRDGLHPVTVRRRLSLFLGVLGLAIPLTALALPPLTREGGHEPYVALCGAFAIAMLATNVIGPEVAVRWAHRVSPARPVTAATIAAKRKDDPANLGLLLAEIDAHFREDAAHLAIGPMREAMDHRQLMGLGRGQIAASLGWTLLHHYPDDPVPTEALVCAEEAERFAPNNPDSLTLQAYVKCHAGEPHQALALAREAETPQTHPQRLAQLDCIVAAAELQLGKVDRALAARDAAAAHWPECDLLPWLDEQIASSTEAPAQPTS